MRSMTCLCALFNLYLKLDTIALSRKFFPLAIMRSEKILEPVVVATSVLDQVKHIIALDSVFIQSIYHNIFNDCGDFKHNLIKVQVVGVKGRYFLARV